MDNNDKFGTSIEQLTAITGDRYLVSDVHHGIGEAVNLCGLLAVRSGWWNRRAPNVPKAVAGMVAEVLETHGFAIGTPLTAEEIAAMVPEKLCLTHSELSEAMEGHRRGRMDDKLPHRPMLEVELADTVIRIFDLASALKIDLAGALVEKLAFNQVREDHKPEARAAADGKTY